MQQVFRWAWTECALHQLLTNSLTQDWLQSVWLQSSPSRGASAASCLQTARHTRMRRRLSLVTRVSASASQTACSHPRSPQGMRTSAACLLCAGEHASCSFDGPPSMHEATLLAAEVLCLMPYLGEDHQSCWLGPPQRTVCFTSRYGCCCADQAAEELSPWMQAAVATGRAAGILQTCFINGVQVFRHSLSLI